MNINKTNNNDTSSAAFASASATVTVTQALESRNNIICNVISKEEKEALEEKITSIELTSKT